MYQRAVFPLVALAALMGSVPAFAQDLSSQVVGVWKLKSYARQDVETGKLEASYGERPTGYAHYSKGGHFVIFVTGDNRSNKDSSPTDVERTALHKSMFPWGGKYKLDGKKIVHSVDISWVQSWVGTTRAYEVEIASNKLTLTTPPFKSTIDGRNSVVVTVYERAE